MILYIGNKLSRHGVSPTSVETLGALLGENYDVKCISDKKNPVIRFLDICLTLITNASRIDMVLIDTYSTWGFYFVLAAAIISKFFRIPYVPILHGGDLPTRLENSPFLSRIAFNNTIKLVAPSNYLKYEFEKRGFKVTFIPNNIEIKDYTFKSRESFAPRLLWVRSFHSIYNAPMALHTLKKLLEKYPDASLCMVGPDKDGTLMQCEELAESLHIKDKIKFTGRLSKQEWHNLSMEYDVFINTTKFDNTPVSVIEAMALGLPVITTNVGGIPYLLEDRKDAILINPGDYEAMAEGIDEIVSNSEFGKSLAITARAKVEGFDWEIVKQQWFELIGGIIKKPIDFQKK